DDEFPQLARIFHLHRQYRNMLVNAKVLSTGQYGPHALSRGDENTRLLSLRNLTWFPKTQTITLDTSIGLAPTQRIVHVKLYHPTERVIGTYAYGENVRITVQPFRASLIKVSTQPADEVVVVGCDYRVVNNHQNDTLHLELLGMPGTSKTIHLAGATEGYTAAKIDEQIQPKLLLGDRINLTFSGTPLQHPFHRKLATLTACAIPEDAHALYEATQFAADNNALEVRSLQRSSPTSIPAVAASRRTFFEQDQFVQRGPWDRYLFDGNLHTSFDVSTRWEAFDPLRTALRIDMGTQQTVDSIIIHVADDFALQPYKRLEGEYLTVSANLKDWESVLFITDTSMVIRLTDQPAFRYLRFPYSMLRIQEVVAYRDGQILNQSAWRASNLQRPYVQWHWDSTQLYSARRAWSTEIELNELAANSYLCIAINGRHGVEGAVAAVKVGDRYLGCPDRSPSYRSNTWEYRVTKSDANYTYYFPLTAELVEQPLEVFVLGFDEDQQPLRPEVWITAYPVPYRKHQLVLHK
ncbi:MAG: hypothetical protein AAGJ82_15015, partial [Bacteroidota bacterium]